MKRIICALLTVLCIFSLGGCKITESVKIDFDRSGKADIICELICDEEALELTGDYEVKEPWGEFKERKKDGKTYYVSSYSLNTDSWEDTEEKLSEMKYGADGKLDMFSSVIFTKTHIELILNPFRLDNSTDDKTVNSVYDVKLVLKAPYKITEYDGGELSNDGKTLTVNIKSPSAGGTVSAQLDYESAFESALKLTAKIIFGIMALSVVAVGIVCMTLHVKKVMQKRKNTNENTENTDIERNTENEKQHINN